MHTLRVEEKGRLVATGAADGSTTLFDICNSLSAIQPGEKQAFNLVLERETKREKNLELRLKEAKLAAKKAEAQAAQAAKGDSAEKEEERLKEVEKEFFEMISSGVDKSTE